MNKIAVVTDSTAYLTSEDINELGAYVVPLSVCFDNVDTYREGAKFQMKTFLQEFEKKIHCLLPLSQQWENY